MENKNGDLLSKLKIERNYCNCHPETCSCDDWNLVYEHEILARHLFKGRLDKLLLLIEYEIMAIKNERH